MSILTQNNLSAFMNSIISKTSTDFKSIFDSQSEFKGIVDYVQLVEGISELTFEIARTLFEHSVEEMDNAFRYSQYRVHQFYVKCKRIRTLITPFGRVISTAQSISIESLVNPTVMSTRN